MAFTRLHLKSVKYVWMRSFIFLIAILIAIFLLFFGVIRAQIDHQVIQTSYSTSNFVKSVIDERLLALQDISFDLIDNRYATGLCSAESEDAFKQSATYELANDMKNFLISNQIVEDVCLYFPSDNYIVGNCGAYRPYAYYLLRNGLSPDGFSDWNKLLQDPKQMQFSVSYGKNGSSLFFSRYTGGSHNRCVLLAKISCKSVENILRWSNSQEPHSLIAILDSKGNFYSAVGDSSLISLTDGHPMAQRSGTSAAQGFLIYVQPSAIHGLSYLLIQDKGQTFATLSTVSLILIVCIVCCLIFGLAISVYLSRKNSRPLQKLMERLNANNREENEYELIGKMIDQMSIDNKSALIELDRQQTLLQHSFVTELLSGGVQREKAIDSLCVRYGISFENPWFCTAVVLMDENDRAVEDLIKKNADTCFFILWASMKNGYAFLLNFEAKDRNDAAEKAGGYMNLFLRQPEGFSLSANRVALSECGQSKEMLVIGYYETLRLLETEQGAFVQAMPGTLPSTRGSGYELYQTFQNALMDGQFQRCIDMLPKLFEGYLDNCDLLVQRCRRYAVVNLVLEAMSTDLSVNFEKESDRIVSNALLPVLQENLSSALRKLEGPALRQHESRSAVAAKAKNMIEHDYANPLLGLYSIAERLGISSSYISRIFKQEYGMGVIEYLNRVRISHAKALISDGSMSMKAVAINVGFSSDVSFIRVFKKYENTTPGKWQI